MKYLLSGISALILGAVSCQVFADGNTARKVVSGVDLSTTRVFYPVGSKSVTLHVNNAADHPFLVQSTVLDEDRHTDAPFIVVPPLFRLDGGQGNTLTITRTGGVFPDDRESLRWLCVKSIPPEADSEWNKGSKAQDKNRATASIRLVTDNCIKLLIRPASVQGNPVDVADKVSWSVSGKTLTGTNPTPFYMNISQVFFNGKKLKMDKSYIPPFSDEKYPLPGHEIKGTVKWTVIGNYGESREKTFSVK